MDGQFNFDWGGFLGAVLGAVAAGAGVVYSLRKTSQADRKKQNEQISSLRRAAIVEAKLGFQNVYHFKTGLSLFLPQSEYLSAFQYWQALKPQVYIYKPSVIPSNLQNISLLAENEIDNTLSLLSGMLDFVQALQEALDCDREEKFAKRFTALYFRSESLIMAMKIFFTEMAPQEKIGSDLVLDGITRIASPLPDYWLNLIRQVGGSDLRPTFKLREPLSPLRSPTNG